MRIEAVAAQFAGLDRAELRLWVERGWVIPDTADDEWDFGEIDVARIQLLRMLRHDLDMSEDSVPVVLSLLDQLYDMRAALRRVMDAIDRQPSELRAAMIEALRSGQR